MSRSRLRQDTAYRYGFLSRRDSRQ